MWLQRSKKSEDTFEVSTDVMILLGTFTGEIKVPKFKLGFFSFFPFFPSPLFYLRHSLDTFAKVRTHILQNYEIRNPFSDLLIC